MIKKIISLTLFLVSVFILSTCGFDESDDYGMAWIPPGTFWMGDDLSDFAIEKPEHQVTLVKGFYMSKFPITQRQYYSVMKVNPSTFEADLAIGGNIPVECVSWYDAIVFCNRLSIREGFAPVYSISMSTNPDDDYNRSTNPEDWIVSSGSIPTSNNGIWDGVRMEDRANGYRLPTEAEWEYACRAGTTTAYNWGDYIYSIQANYGSSVGSTTFVGSYAPNAWGLYDMHGNVLEWCWDWNGNYGSGQQMNPMGASSGSYRVLRGGSWSATAPAVRSAFRNLTTPPFDRHGNVGFRLVRP